MWARISFVCCSTILVSRQDVAAAIGNTPMSVPMIVEEYDGAGSGMALGGMIAACLALVVVAIMIVAIVMVVMVVVAIIAFAV